MSFTLDREIQMNPKIVVSLLVLATALYVLAYLNPVAAGPLCAAATKIVGMVVAKC